MLSQWGLADSSLLPVTKFLPVGVSQEVSITHEWQHVQWGHDVSSPAQGKSQLDVSQRTQ